MLTGAQTSKDTVRRVLMRVGGKFFEMGSMVLCN